MNPTVRIPAVLCGMGTESKCILETWQDRSSTGRVFTRCRITDEPHFLPDGAYELRFAEHTVATRKFSGAWELVFLPPGIKIDPARWATGKAS